MYAIVDIQGQQFNAEAAKNCMFIVSQPNKALLSNLTKYCYSNNDGTVKVGAPTVEGAKVVCEVLSHLKGERIIVFKKKRRKGISQTQRTPSMLYTSVN